jgi:HlyD family secretion protein
MKRILIIVVVLLVIAGLIAGGVFYLRRQSKKEADKPTDVRIEKVTEGELIEIVSAPGEIQPKTKVSISARVAARIAELPYVEGDTVTKGDPMTTPPVPASVLVRLDATDLVAALKKAQAGREAQRAQITMAEARVAGQRATIAGTSATLVEARHQFERDSQLMQSQQISQTDFEQTKRRYEELQAQLEAAQHSLEADIAGLSAAKHNLVAAEAEITRAEDNLSYTVLTSPIDGVITRINAKVGELVMTGTMNNAGTVILEVADLSKMILSARIDESDIAEVRVGQPAKIRVQAYPDRVFDGVVQTVALASSSDKDVVKHFKTEVALVTNGDRIFSGLTADVDIETTRHKGVLMVPSQAVLGRPVDDIPTAIRDKATQIDKKKTLATVVYRMIDGKALVTPVKIGPSDATHTMIESGVSKGDPVIVGPYKILDALKNEQKVKEEVTSGTLGTSGTLTLKGAGTDDKSTTGGTGDRTTTEGKSK